MCTPNKSPAFVWSKPTQNLKYWVVPRSTVTNRVAVWDAYSVLLVLLDRTSISRLILTIGRPHLHAAYRHEYRFVIIYEYNNNYNTIGPLLRVFPRNNKVSAHGPMSLKFDGPLL